ncbi:hypothetical protein H0I76_11500 [Limibaculum sp. M0105]|uniref:Uncharacterized protein n=1 Tax=Thermohalobaculum xanthum TaxID=2753746 RepID=A0A8J7M8E3_9RHOB|nr:hypothetical protein [Thermohalobaculum xanthum]MBK0399817.1 hypothetical protein [Thermohalobaculum xanthum]
MTSNDDFGGRVMEPAGEGDVADALALLVRAFMRAIASGQVGHRVRAARAFIDLLRCLNDADDFRLKPVIDEAMDALSVEVPWEHHDAKQLSVARPAVRYIVEMSCTDAAARGRASQCWQKVEENFIAMLDERYGRPLWR